VSRVDDLETTTSELEDGLLALGFDKMDKIGEITLEGVFTPIGGTGAYIAI